MIQKFLKIFKDKDLRNNILFVLALLAVFRVAAHIPIPGIDAEALKRFFSSNQIFGLVNVFSGGAMSNFSIVALGVAPYITSSIIFQLLNMIIPTKRPAPIPATNLKRKSLRKGNSAVKK